MLAIDRCAALRHVSIFADAADPTLSHVAATSRWQRYASGNTILSYQDNSTDIFFVLEGRARAVIYSFEGKASLFADLNRGDVFGEIAAIDGGRRSAGVEAIESTLVAAMTASAFEEILRGDPDVSLATLKLLTRTVRRLSDRVYEFRALAVQNRIQAEFLRLAVASGATTGEVLLSPAPPLAEIADRVSTHREAVSRELSRLGALGLIVRDGGALRITDLPRLSELVREARGE